MQFLAQLVRSRWLALGTGILVCALCWNAERRLVGEWGFPLDDTWIHCQIARNLVQGHGWSYNPGIAVQNSSGPLWTALVALGFAVFGPSLWVVKVLGVMCYLGCIAITAILARLWSGDRTSSGVAALLAATSVPLAWHGLSGMETPLAALLVGAALATFQRWTEGRRRWVWPVLAALAVATRPETLCLVPLLAIEHWRRQRRMAGPSAGRWAGARETVLALGLAAVVLAPYFALNLRLSSSLFPTTFGAKAGATGLASALRNRDSLEMLLSLTTYPYVWSVHTLSYFGRLNLGLLLAAPFGAWAAARHPRGFLTPALLLFSLPALRGVAAPHVLPGVHEGRYIGCLLPVFYACAGVGLVSLLRDSAGDFWKSRWTRVLAGIGLVLVAAAWARLELGVPHIGPGFLQALPNLLRGGRIEAGIDATLQFERLGLFVAVLLSACLLLAGGSEPRTRRLLAFVLLGLAAGIQAWRLPRLPQNYSRNVRDIQAMDVSLGRWVKQSVPPGTLVAVNDIGAIAYCGERPLVDVIGLATPELTQYASPQRLRTLVGMRRLAPELCIIFPNWFPEWTSRPSLFRPILQNEVPGPTILGGSVAIVYRLDWERFARYYDDALLERVDQPEVYAGLTGHLRRAMRNLGVATGAQLHANAGDLLLERRQLKEAERLYQRATTLDPWEMAGWRGLLQLYHTQGRRDDLGRALQEMVRLQPDSPGAFEALAQWQDASGLHETARTTYGRALALHPDNVRLLAKLERSLAAQGNEAEAATVRARRLELESPPPPLLRPRAASMPG